MDATHPDAQPPADDDGSGRRSPATGSSADGNGADVAAPAAAAPERGLGNGAVIRIALVGAGFIAESHLRVLKRVAGARVVAVCDPSAARAERIARLFGVPKVYRSLADMLAAGEGVDAVHVLVPPDWHAELATKSLEAGLHTFVEKPLALDSETCRRLGELARAKGVELAVNHNMAWMPVWRRLERDLEHGRFGRVEHVQILHHVGLRQMAMREYDHFLFQSPANILLEQAVHLFSLVERVLGRCRRARAHVVGRGQELPGGGTFHDTWSVTLVCERGTAELFLAFGRTMPEVFAHVVGADAAARIDLLRGTYVRVGKSAQLEALDHGLGAAWSGFDLVRQGFGRVASYTLDLLRLGRRGGDPFARSMDGSIRDFVESIRTGARPSGHAGAAEAVLEMCERTAQAADVSFERRQRPADLPDPGPPRTGEVVVTGGTGFVGGALVPQLLDAGHPVTLLVRRPGVLPPEVHGDGRIRLVRGDASDPEALARAFEGARVVVHMATCAGSDPDRADRAMEEAARAVVDACGKAGVRRVLFVSSTAALYLGGSDPVHGGALDGPHGAPGTDTGPDPKPASRPVYARGKILAERVFADFARRQDACEVVILRPAIVVGAGGNLQHTGVGLWPSDTHCVGWGSGDNPLPFVLVSDCAAALAAAVDRPGIGGMAFDLAGDVRWTAEQYVTALRRRSGRAFRFHPQPLWWFWTVEAAKWALKRAVGRAAVYTSWRDFKSRSFQAPLDCTPAKESLGWEPVADAAVFEERAIAVHCDERSSR